MVLLTQHSIMLLYNPTLGVGVSDVGKHGTVKITTGSSGEITAVHRYGWW